MSFADLARVREAIVSLKLNGANQEVAEHWVSRWHGAQPPKMGSFNTDVIRQHKPAMMICRIVQGEILHCISGGAIIRVALGFDISRQDLLALTPASEREALLAYWWLVVEGAVSVTHRLFKSRDGRDAYVQGVGLPFSDRNNDGSRYFLMHTNWRPAGTDWIQGNVEVDLQNTRDRRAVSYLNTAPDNCDQTVLI